MKSGICVMSKHSDLIVWCISACRVRILNTVFLLYSHGENRPAEKLDTQSVQQGEEMLTLGVILSEWDEETELKQAVHADNRRSILSGLIIVNNRSPEYILNHILV